MGAGLCAVTAMEIVQDCSGKNFGVGEVIILIFVPIQIEHL